MQFPLSILNLDKRLKTVNTVLSFASAGLLVAFGILNFSITGTPFNHIILQLYYICFALLIVAAECNFKSTMRLFGFLGNLFGKGIFVLLVGLSMFGGDFNLKQFIAIALIVFGIVFMLMFFVPAKCLTKKDTQYADGTAARN